MGLSEDGNALIEVALTLPLLALILVGAVNYGFYVQEKMQVQEAAAAGTAYALIPGNTSNTSGIQNAALAASPYLSGLSASAASFQTCTPGGSRVSSSSVCSGNTPPITYVQVQTSATVSAPLSFPGVLSSLVLHAQSTYRVP